MDFEWDEAKRHANILKHGIDFVDAIEAFREGQIKETEDVRRNYGEQRFRTFGESAGQLLHIVWTWRGDRRRIISARRARRNERRTYYESNPGPSQEDEEPH